MMRVGATSKTGGDEFFSKLDTINRCFEDKNRKILFKKDYGGNLCLSLIMVISIYEEEDINLLKFNQMKSLERWKNFDGEIELTLIFKIMINPLVVKKLSINDLKELWCNLVIERINNPLFRIPKRVDYEQLKVDLIELVEDFNQLDLENI